MTADGYTERLRCPVSWYATGAVGGLVVAPEISFVTPVPVLWSMAIGVVFALVVVTWIGRTTVQVVAGELRVRGARLPVRYVSDVVVLDAPTMRRLLGRDGDPAAFLATKPWVSTGLQVVLDDPDDPAPYWAVSTRRPRHLAGAILRSQRLTDSPRPGADA